jgi:hypothetical protein
MTNAAPNATTARILVITLKNGGQRWMSRAHVHFGTFDIL